MVDSPSTPQAVTDWSHVRETINMLYLAVCQIEATLGDSNSAVETLTQSFLRLAEHAKSVDQQIQDIQQVEDLVRFKRGISDAAGEMGKNINASIEAFQFYDRICQRLDHVARGLENVSRVMADDQQIDNPAAWERIQGSIKNSYTMEAERIMFEFIMRGGSVQEALQIYRHHFNRPETFDGSKDEILLF